MKWLSNYFRKLRFFTKGADESALVVQKYNEKDVHHSSSEEVQSDTSDSQQKVGGDSATSSGVPSGVGSEIVPENPAELDHPKHPKPSDNSPEVIQKDNEKDVHHFSSEEVQSDTSDSQQKVGGDSATRSGLHSDLGSEKVPENPAELDHEKHPESSDNSSEYFDSLVADLNEVDLSSPPGFAGEICDDVIGFERRALASVRPAVALTVLTLLANGKEGIHGEKIAFYCFITALTASGKEALIKYLRAITIGLWGSDDLPAEPRSDKDIMIDLVEMDRVLYVLDEAQKFFSKALSSNGSPYEQAIGDLLMELKTTNLFPPPKSVKKELKPYLTSLIERSESNQGQPSTDEKELMSAKAQLKKLEFGVVNPCVTLIGFSTPAKSNFIINTDTINSGFVARFHWFNGGENRSKIKLKEKILESFIVRSKPAAEIIKKCGEIIEKEVTFEFADQSAEELFTEIVHYFEDDERLNHQQMGAIHARAIEQILNTSSLLAIETGKITREILLYSTKLFLSNVTICDSVASQKQQVSRSDIMISAERAVKRKTMQEGALTKAVLANYVKNCDSTIRAKTNTTKDFHHEVVGWLINYQILVPNGTTKTGVVKYHHKQS